MFASLIESGTKTPAKTRSDSPQKTQNTFQRKKTSLEVKIEEQLRRQTVNEQQRLRNKEKEERLILERRIDKLGDTQKKMDYRFSISLLKMVEEMENKLKSDKSLPHAVCGNGHRLEHVAYHVPEEDVLYNCRDCGQPSVNSLNKGYFMCTHPDCDPNNIHKDVCKEKCHINCSDA